MLHHGKKAPPAGLRQRLRALAHIPVLVSMVWEVSPWMLGSLLALRILKSMIPVAMLWVAKSIIDQVLTPGHERIWTLVALEAGLAVLDSAILRLLVLIDSLLGERFTNHVSVRLMEHATRLDLRHFEDAEFYDKLERARMQTTMRMGLLSSTSAVVQEALTLATLAAGLILYSPWLVALLAIAVLPAFLGETHFAGLSYSMMYRRTPQRRELDYVRYLGASAESAKEVKIFGLGGHLTRRYRELSDRFYLENRKLALKRAGLGAAFNVLGIAGYYTAYLLILQRTLNGELKVGDLVFLAGAFARSRNLMDTFFATLAMISEQALHLTDLFTFFALRPAIVPPPDAIPAPRPIRSGFEFRNVGFTYPGASRPVLRDVSFHIGPGERVALIGENGAGKTTITKLMARLYDPTEGQILLDGRDLRSYDIESLREEIGVIFQDYMRYDLPVRDNIGFGRISAIGDQGRIEEAARKSLADRVIARLNTGYQTMLGRRFEGATDLSAGQWQKIALARAYMRDAQLLILDEPTASLDARAEYEVFQQFADLTRDRMAVLISHRFSTVRMADRILVLEHGQVVEHGSHESLVARGGRYAELFELQAAGYR